SRMDESARALLHRREGRPGQDRELGFRAREPEWPHAPRLEPQLDEDRRHRHGHGPPRQEQSARRQRELGRARRRQEAVRRLLDRERAGGRAFAVTPIAISAITIDDPTAYTKPFTVRMNQRLLGGAELAEFICNE